MLIRLWGLRSNNLSHFFSLCGNHYFCHSKINPTFYWNCQWQHNLLYYCFTPCHLILFQYLPTTYNFCKMATYTQSCSRHNLITHAIFLEEDSQTWLSNPYVYMDTHVHITIFLSFSRYISLSFTQIRFQIFYDVRFVPNIDFVAWQKQWIQSK